MKLPCHLLLAKLAAAAPGQLLANLHRLTDPLEKTLQTKVKGEAVKQEVCSSHTPHLEFVAKSSACLLLCCPSPATYQGQTRSCTVCARLWQLAWQDICSVVHFPDMMWSGRWTGTRT